MIRVPMARLALALLLMAPLFMKPWAANARVLEAGPGKPFKQPSEAIGAAGPGDTVRIAPGEYFDCAFVRQDGLIIEGAGPGVILTDKTCGGKALLVISGANVTVRNLTLQRARVPDRNGAGIRAEGGDLLVQNTQFINNENGLMSAANPAASIRVLNSQFIGNGRCLGSCSHGIYAGQIKLLRVEKSRFLDTHEGHHIKSRALRTEVIECDIQDGPTGTSSYLIEIPNGGSLLAERNRMQKGALSQNQGNTISIGAEGVSQPTAEITLRGNVFANDQGRETVFVNNLTATRAQLSGNVFRGQVKPLVGDGDSR